MDATIEVGAPSKRFMQEVSLHDSLLSAVFRAQRGFQSRKRWLGAEDVDEGVDAQLDLGERPFVGVEREPDRVVQVECASPLGTLCGEQAGQATLLRHLELRQLLYQDDFAHSVRSPLLEFVAV